MKFPTNSSHFMLVVNLQNVTWNKTATNSCCVQMVTFNVSVLEGPLTHDSSTSERFIWFFYLHPDEMGMTGVSLVMLTALKNSFKILFGETVSQLLWIIHGPHCEQLSMGQLLNQKTVLLKTADNVFCGLSGVTRTQFLKKKKKKNPTTLKQITKIILKFGRINPITLSTVI